MRTTSSRRRTRAGSACWWTSCRTTRPTSTHGSRPRSRPRRARRNGRATTSAMGVARTGRNHRTTGGASSAGRPGPERARPTGVPASGPAPLRPTPTWTGRPERPGRVRVDPPVLARPRRGRLPHRRRPFADQGSDLRRRGVEQAPPTMAARGRDPSPLGSRRCPRDLPSVAGDRGRVRHRARVFVGEVFSRARAPVAATCGPTSCTWSSTSTSRPRPGRVRRSGRRSMRPLVDDERRRADDVGPVEPRQQPPPHPIRSDRHDVEGGRRRPGRPRAGRATRSRRGAPAAGAARGGVPVPGRGAGAAGGGGPAHRNSSRTRSGSAPSRTSRGRRSTPPASRLAPPGAATSTGTRRRPAPEAGSVVVAASRPPWTGCGRQRKTPIPGRCMHALARGPRPSDARIALAGLGGWVDGPPRHPRATSDELRRVSEPLRRPVAARPGAGALGKSLLSPPAGPARRHWYRSTRAPGSAVLDSGPHGDDREE